MINTALNQKLQEIVPSNKSSKTEQWDDIKNAGGVEIVDSVYDQTMQLNKKFLSRRNCIEYLIFSKIKIMLVSYLVDVVIKLTDSKRLQRDKETEKAKLQR
ncbi:hypothetical protein WA026_016890 [Henosepilachna vigintioctopunctata]|uniref:Uncharacterized protein n=1 Tax=Henosepilachna vigintioctopunctata TaxID=420089 RepID=A0AAW1U8W7_9CUCU